MSKSTSRHTMRVSQLMTYLTLQRTTKKSVMLCLVSHERSWSCQEITSQHSATLLLVSHSLLGSKLRLCLEINVCRSGTTWWLISTQVSPRSFSQALQLVVSYLRHIFKLLWCWSFLLCIVSKGTSAHLFKTNAKRRRSKAQIEEEKQTAQQQKQEIDEKLAQFNSM